MDEINKALRALDRKFKFEPPEALKNVTLSESKIDLEKHVTALDEAIKKKKLAADLVPTAKLVVSLLKKFL